ncbi:fibropellin-1-like isoform X2 [Dendronephthya gigantea]|uniref:fibropellin-1-like isoform X2 n=1 Tax=Dendronephthya gigantea TaxID=151771 RepID=UPI00106ADF9B|nr:fibropellin-1-like isoform X2 [Dendronephthya gigantea]
MLSLTAAIFLVIYITVVAGNASTEVILTCKETGTKIVKKGCFKDPSREDRTLPELLANFRDKIDWNEWKNFLDTFSCECAKQARKKDYRYFGLQFYGECWSGMHSERLFSIKKPSQCLGYEYKTCEDSTNSACTGGGGYNYVYEIVYEETETNLCEELSPCVNGECVSTGDSYMCDCLSGYEGVNCDTLIDNDDCANSPCVNGECIDGKNSYECKCSPGYNGQNCEKNIDDCANSPCVNGDCIDKVNSYECRCTPGYNGQNCEKNIDDCANSPCVNGDCIDKVNSYECRCTPGYNGQNCENNIDDCANSPCVNGDCIDKVNSYECRCTLGYNGQNCENNIDDCANSPCVNGDCIDKVNSYECRCTLGYNGQNCENNIDDCANSPCVNGDCIDKVNAYECKCTLGYHGQNCEKNIDDCAKKPCRNGGRCVDKVNSYQCVCKSGYNGANCETNIDDCAKKPCRNGGRCVDKVNSYQCVCKTGFNGVNCETNIDDCAKKPCRNGGRCVDKVNSYQCICKTGFNGVTCETNIDDCAKNPCRNGAKCVDKVNSYQCICKTGYSGVNCDSVTIKPNYCKNANWWHSFDKKGWSTCNNNKLFITGFYRNKLDNWDKDQIYRLEEARCCSSNSLYLTQSSECTDANWWASLDKPSTWSLCPKGYFLNGLYRTSGNNLHNIEEGRCCKPVTHPKDYGHCYNEYIRHEFDKRGWTSCMKTGYYVVGVYRDHNKDWLHDIDYLRCCKMSTDVDHCAKNPCRNGGRCVDKAHSYQCVCKTGFNGVNCETNIDDCAKKPCRNGGRCVDKVNSYQCVCKSGYSGVNCDIIVTVKPNYCKNANWWHSFDRKGWSTCNNNKLFITGFYRNKLDNWDKDQIYRLEEAQCCSSNSLYLTQSSVCTDANWWASLDKRSTWSLCPEGYFLNGLYRTSGNNLHNIEEGRCCKPVNHPKNYENCYNEYIRHKFDKQGWTKCMKTGYYVVGVYRDHNKDWLHDIDYLKCCKMWTRL